MRLYSKTGTKSMRFGWSMRCMRPDSIALRHAVRTLPAATCALRPRIRKMTVNRYMRDGIDACVDLGAELFVGLHYSVVGRAGAESAEAKREQWKLVFGQLKKCAATPPIGE